jgi:hypothetical protein
MMTEGIDNGRKPMDSTVPLHHLSPRRPRSSTWAVQIPFTYTGSMVTEHKLNATLLPDGKVLVMAEAGH